MKEFLEPRSERSARLLALMMLWIARTLSALLVASPLVFAIQASGLVSGPERDAPLFRAGALVLLELIRVGAPELGAAGKIAALLLLLSGLFGLLALGASLASLCEKTALNFGENARRGASYWLRFVGLSVIAGLSYAALLLLCSLLSGALGSALHGANERAQTLAPLALVALGLGGAFVIGAVHDLARAVVVEKDERARPALLGALSVLRARPAAVLLGAFPSVSANACAWLVAASVLMRLDLSASRIVALAFVIHQAAIFFALVFRVRWLERALELAADLESAGQ